MTLEKFSLMIFPFAIEKAKRTLSIDDIFRLAHECGLCYVDTMRISNKEIPKYLDAMKKNHVRIFCHIENISFFARKSSIHKNIISKLIIAKKLGAEKLMIVPYIPIIDTHKAKKLTRQKIMEKLYEGFSIAVIEARKVGIEVCFETTPQEIIKLSGTDDCRELLDRIGELQFVFDTANMLPHGDEPFDSLQKLMSRISYVHLKDVELEDIEGFVIEPEKTKNGKLMKCCVWGKGTIPIKTIYNTLISEGYAGKFAIEYARPCKECCEYEEHKRQIMRFIDVITGE